MKTIVGAQADLHRIAPCHRWLDHCLHGERSAKDHAIAMTEAPSPSATGKGGRRLLPIIGIAIASVSAIVTATGVMFSLLSDRVSDVNNRVSDVNDRVSEMSAAIQSEATKRENSMMAINQRIDRLYKQTMQISDNIDVLPSRVNTAISGQYFPLLDVSKFGIPEISEQYEGWFVWPPGKDTPMSKYIISFPEGIGIKQYDWMKMPGYMVPIEPAPGPVPESP